jgi:hypothetical protein
MTVSKNRRSRGPAWLMTLVVIAGVVLVGSVVAVAYVASGGEIPIPFSNPPRYFSLKKKEVEKPWTPPVGKTPVPAAARPIAAYAEVTLQDFYNPTTKQLVCQYVDPAKLEAEKDDPIFVDVTKITGRVLKQSVIPGTVFRESHFYPEGTRPGLVAGVPAGYRGYRIELSRARGLYDLKAGDLFDLVATIPVSNDASQDLRKMGGAYGSQLAIEASFSNVSKQATVRTIVKRGIVVEAMRTIEIPTTMASLTQGNKVNGKPQQEVYIAVHPEEVPLLDEAKAVGAELSVVARSGRPDDPADSVTPDKDPTSPLGGKEGVGGLTFVETIGGTTRERVPVPTGASKESPPDDKK